jgi:2'-5' RNA ligase
VPNQSLAMASESSQAFQLISNQTAIALIVPENLQPEINSLRKVHDKAFRKWQPHINILYPFVQTPSLSSAVATLRQCAEEQQLKGVKVNIDAVDTFKHRRNATIFLKPDNNCESRLLALRGMLVKALGCDESEGTHDGVFRPHLTIGQADLNGVAIERLTGKVQSLVGLNWDACELAVLRRETSGEMSIVEKISLSGIGEDGGFRDPLFIGPKNLC